MRVAAVVPQFFTPDICATLKYYDEKLDFVTRFTYGDPPFFAAAARNGFPVFFRIVDEPLPISPDKYEEELLDAYVMIRGKNAIDRLFEDFDARGVDFHRRIATMLWAMREFVVKDCDGRLLAFGQSTEELEQD